MDTQRVIKFRGLRALNSKWAYGDVHFNSDRTLCHIHENGDRVRSCPVLPETVGQFTGLLDKNGKDLDWWEGDILELDGGASGAHVIEWDNNGACFMCGGDELLVNVRDGYKTEKIGNIHTHPELLE